MDETKMTIGHCPDCGPDRNAKIVGHHEYDGKNNKYGIWWSNKYDILKCAGCDVIYFRVTEIFSENFTLGTDPETGEETWEPDPTVKFWPEEERFKRAIPEWITVLLSVQESLGVIFQQTYEAYEKNLNVFVCIGMRTVFDMATDLLGLSDCRGFDDKLAELVKRAIIGTTERDHLKVLTDVGNAAAHRGWWLQDDTEINTLMTVMEHFLYRNFVLPAEVSAIQAKVPVRTSRSNTGKSRTDQQK